MERERASVLILHGIGERLSYWNDAQQFLAANEIASLVLSYSGYGRSDGTITPSNLQEDVIAGYTELRRLIPATRPPFLLGLSLGTGVAVTAAPYLEPAPSGVILCEPFSSLRSAAEAACRSLPLPRSLAHWLARLMPDLYRTAGSIGGISVPLLMVHSDADELFPVSMAEVILSAVKRVRKRDAELVIVEGYAHNDAYLRPSLGYWQPILDFMGRRSR